jgi:hypothetical protein
MLALLAFASQSTSNGACNNKNKKYAVYAEPGDGK